MCRDPNTIEARVMVSSTGHDGPMGASGVSFVLFYFFIRGIIKGSFFSLSLPLNAHTCW